MSRPEKASGGKKKWAVGILLAVFAVFLFDWLFSKPGDDIPSDESAAAKSLATYQDAQEKFYDNDFDGDGFPNYAVSFKNLCNLKDKTGELVNLIPPLMGEADSPAKAYKGYYFNDITNWEARRQGYGLCANPAEYGKPGRKTFIISKAGTIYWKDFGATKPITSWPSDPAAEGWKSK